MQSYKDFINLICAFFLYFSFSKLEWIKTTDELNQRERDLNRILNLYKYIFEKVTEYLLIISYKLLQTIKQISILLFNEIPIINLWIKNENGLGDYIDK